MDRLKATLAAAALIATAAATAPDVAAHSAPMPGHTYTAPSGRSITLDGHGVVTESTLRQCRQEDGSGRRAACTWNVDTGTGNGIGLAFYLPHTTPGQHPAARRARYVWATDPVAGHPRRVWITPAQAAAVPSVGRRCYVHVGATSTIVCPDGTRVRS